tara:strand:+ start:327 stop:677 length:351 start_codon:yes stop_codon:yes gene_type:complete
MDKLKQNLGSIVTLIAMVGAIGGGFVKYGEIVTKLEVLEKKEYSFETVDLTPLEERYNALVDKINDNHGTLIEKININKNDVLTNKSNQLILKAENELFSSRLDEMYIKNSNPLLQ